MRNATKNKILPATIIGSLPRPSWYAENLGTRSFLDARVNSRYRKQYIDSIAGCIPVVLASAQAPVAG